MIVTLRNLFVVLLSMLVIGTGAAAHSVGHDTHGQDVAGLADCAGHADHVATDLAATGEHRHCDADLANNQHCSGTPCPFLSVGPEAAYQDASTRRIAIAVFADEELISNPAETLRRPPKA